LKKFVTECRDLLNAVTECIADSFLLRKEMSIGKESLHSKPLQHTQCTIAM